MNMHSQKRVAPTALKITEVNSAPAIELSRKDAEALPRLENHSSSGGGR